MSQTQMPRKISLDVVTVESPCEVPWEEMAGDEQVRFCKHCTQNVYNISALTRQAAEELINKHEGRLCVRYFVRPDATIVTAECAPRRALRLRRVRRWAGLALAALGLTALATIVSGAVAADELDKQLNPKAPPMPVRSYPAVAGMLVEVPTTARSTPPSTFPATPPTSGPSTPGATVSK